MKFKIGDWVINKHLHDIMVYTKLDPQIWRSATVGQVASAPWNFNGKKQISVRYENGAELMAEEDDLIHMEQPSMVFKDMLK